MFEDVDTKYSLFVSDRSVFLSTRQPTLIDVIYREIYFLLGLWDENDLQTEMASFSLVRNTGQQ